jgi:phosphoglycerol transferase MdoB-like AlkP superfamily enzyme
MVTKISYITCFSAMASVFGYGYFIMDGRTTLNNQDRTFLLIMIILVFISLLFMIADRAKSKGGKFSWKRFGVLIMVMILFGICRVIV